jgi:phytoene synthase
MTLFNDLSDIVRRVDEDRWLASRFATAEVRRRLITLYALNHEIARTVEVVTQPALGDIRLTWWREAIAEIYEGEAPRAQPALLALAEVKSAWGAGAFDALIEARRRDLDAQPFATWAELDAYIDGTAGQVMRLAAVACDAAADEALLVNASRVWGYTAWFRAGRAAPVGETSAALLDRAREAHAARTTIPANLFPALGYVALVPGYIRAFARKRPTPALFLRQLRLIAASATGRI